MRRVVTWIGLLLGITLLVLTGFFFWASSAVVDRTAQVALRQFGTPAPAADTFAVMTYNIGYLSGMTNNRPVDRSEALVAEHLTWASAMIQASGAEVVALQEIDFAAARSYDVDQLDTLAVLGGYHAAAAVVNWNRRYVPFPYGWPSQHFGRIVSGQGVLSRFPVLQQGRYSLQRPATPFYYDAFYLDRLAQVVLLDLGQPLVVINVHLEAYDVPTRIKQAEQVRALYERYRADYAVLLVGDFNAVLPQDQARVAWADEDREWTHADRTAEILLAAPGLQEAFSGFTDSTMAQPGTFPADTPRLKIDHLFYDADRLEPLAAFVIDGPRQPSDHRAAVARFRFKKTSSD